MWMSGRFSQDILDDPFGQLARGLVLFQDDQHSNARSYIGADCIFILLPHQPDDPVIRDKVVYQGYASKYPRGRGRTRIEEPPCGKAKECQFEQQPQRTRYGDWRLTVGAGILRHTEVPHRNAASKGGPMTSAYRRMPVCCAQPQ